MHEGAGGKMDPEQPQTSSAAAVGSEPEGPPAAAESMGSKGQQSAEKVEKVPVQQSASAYRDRDTAALPLREQRSTASQQQRAASTDKQSVTTSKTESKLFLVSASTASVMGSAVTAPEPAPGPEPKPSGKASAASRLGSLTRPSGSLLARGPRSRSAMSIRGASSSRGSIASRGSKNTATFDFLSPGLQDLIRRIADTKDVGLIAYLSAIPGEPHGATRPPAAVTKLQQKQSGRPKSIMKMSKPTVRFEPTYRLEPLRPFRVDRALALVQTALEMGMAEATYSPQWATDAVRILAAYITQCVKGAETQTPGNRYKIATVVTVMERRSQGVRTEGAVLWDDNLDRIISASVETNSMIACAVVYAVFWE